MNTLLIVTAIFLYTLQTVALKNLNAKNIYSTIIVTSAFSAIIAVFLFILNVNRGITVSSQTITWGIVFGAISITILCCENMALQTGPMSYTVFFISASMVIPTVGGIILWKEPMTISIATGLLLFLISLYLILVAGKKENEKRNIKWMILCLITWLLNGCSSLVTKTHQTIMNGKESSELMMVGFAVAALLSATAILSIKKYYNSSRTKQIKTINFSPKFFFLLLLTAIGSGGGNILTTILAGKVAASILFPFLLGGMTVATTLYSLIFEKAKISIWGKLGLLVGIAAITVINIP